MHSSGAATSTQLAGQAGKHLDPPIHPVTNTITVISTLIQGLVWQPTGSTHTGNKHKPDHGTQQRRQAEAPALAQLA